MVYADAAGAAPGATPGAGLALVTPAERQVIQRAPGNRADVRISGNVTRSQDRIEARVANPAPGEHGGWQTISVGPVDGQFTGVLPGVLAGGWYRLEIRTVDDGIPSAVQAVQRVGIGDVYVTAGQSNSANYGAPVHTPGDRVVVRTSVTGSSWRVAADPLPMATGTGGSVWSRLGDLLVAAENVPVGFIAVGVGSTNIAQWVPGGSSYYDTRLKPALLSLGTGGFRAVLWHQGESDSLATTSADDYEARINDLIATSRADLGWTVPWYLARAAYHARSSLAQEIPVNAGQRSAAYADPHVYLGPRTDDFHQQGKVVSDGVHFNAAGLADHAAQWSAILSGNPEPAIVNGTFEGNPALRDGGVHVVNAASLASPSVIGWETLAASGRAPAGAAGYYNPSADFYTRAGDADASGGVLPDMVGRHVGFLYAGSAGSYVEQTTPRRAEPGEQVTLSASLGRRRTGTFGRARLDILADGMTVESRTITASELADDGFTRITLTATVPADATPGQALAVRITKLDGGSDTYLDFDAVGLTGRQRAG